MVRDLDRLTASTFDVLVVGGGIYGLAIAYDAAQRGLSVGLVEERLGETDGPVLVLPPAEVVLFPADRLLGVVEVKAVRFTVGRAQVVDQLHQLLDREPVEISRQLGPRRVGVLTQNPHQLELVPPPGRVVHREEHREDVPLGAGLGHRVLQLDPVPLGPLDDPGAGLPRRRQGDAG